MLCSLSSNSSLLAPKLAFIRKKKISFVPLQLQLNKDGNIIDRKDQEFVFLPTNAQMQIDPVLPLGVDALRSILPVSYKLVN